jgi:hypothetical protein
LGEKAKIAMNFKKSYKKAKIAKKAKKSYLA